MRYSSPSSISMSVEHHETHFAHTLNSQEEIETTGRGAKVTDVESVRVKDPRLKMAVRGGGKRGRGGGPWTGKTCSDLFPRRKMLDSP